MESAQRAYDVVNWSRVELRRQRTDNLATLEQKAREASDEAEKKVQALSDALETLAIAVEDAKNNRSIASGGIKHMENVVAAARELSAATKWQAMKRRIDEDRQAAVQALTATSLYLSRTERKPFSFVNITENSTFNLLISQEFSGGS